MIKHDPKNTGEIYQNIPTYNNGVWELTSFNTREEFAKELESVYFREPGTYEFDDSVKVFNHEANYCEFLEGTIDYEDYWDFEKLKSRKGLFVWNNGKKWYLPRDYYFWINFLPIIDKVKKKTDFPDLWDTQMWMSTYELIAELKYRHASVLKKRQFGSSLYHIAKLINHGNLLKCIVHS
jgi:hypothetical protein